MKKLTTLLITILAFLSAPKFSWATGGHNEKAAQLFSDNPGGPNLIFLIMLGNIIVISIVAAEVIRTRKEHKADGTNP